MWAGSGVQVPGSSSLRGILEFAPSHQLSSTNCTGGFEEGQRKPALSCRPREWAAATAGRKATPTGERTANTVTHSAHRGWGREQKNPHTDGEGAESLTKPHPQDPESQCCLRHMSPAQLICFVLFFPCFCLKQSLAMQPRLAFYSRSFCLALSSAGITTPVLIDADGTLVTVPGPRPSPRGTGHSWGSQLKDPVSP